MPSLKVILQSQSEILYDNFDLKVVEWILDTTNYDYTILDLLNGFLEEGRYLDNRHFGFTYLTGWLGG